MELNTPHFNAIAGQFLTEAKKPYSAKQAKKDKDTGKSKKQFGKIAKSADKKSRVKGK